MSGKKNSMAGYLRLSTAILFFSLIFTQEDVNLLARVLWCECRGESREGQLAVAQTVIDRFESGKCGSSIERTIKAKGQFVWRGKLKREQQEIARAVLEGERYRKDCRILYFRETESKKDWYKPFLFELGCHKFYGDRL